MINKNNAEHYTQYSMLIVRNESKDFAIFMGLEINYDMCQGRLFK